MNSKTKKSNAPEERRRVAGRPMLAAPKSDSATTFLDKLGLSIASPNPLHWQRNLLKPNRFAQLQRRFGAGRTSPLLWGVAIGQIDADVLASIQFSYDLARGVRKQILEADLCELEIRNFLSAEEPDVGELESAAIFIVHLAQQSPLLMAHVPLESGCTFIERLCLRIDRGRDTTFSNPRVEQLLKIELPLTLAHQFPEFEALRPLVTEAASAWEKSLVRWLDESGALDDRWWPQHRAIFAAWLRCYRLIRSLGQPKPASETMRRIIGLFRQVQRATCSKSEVLLVSSDVTCGYRRMIHLAESILDEKAEMRDRPKKKRLAALGSSSEAAGLTLMQTKWGPRGAKIAVRHPDQEFSLHLWRSQSLLFGECLPEVHIGAERAAPRDRWEVSCWHSDADVQLLDLELKLDHGARLERTIVLGIKDEFLLIADTISADEPQNFSYTAEFPLSAGIFASGEQETTEVYLRNQVRLRSLVLPLALPEWKSSRGSGSLQFSPVALQLRQKVKSRCLYAALFFDLKPNRSLSARTWRPLTVARQRAIVSADEAVAYRIRVGYKQWLLFRSFGQQEPYSVLSKHLMCEFYLGRIEKDQSITDLIRIG